MDRAFESGAVALAPTAPVTPSIGYPTNGNPVGGTPATKPGDWWFHMITEELRAIVSAGGLTPDRLVLDQLLQALPAALASRPEWARSLSVSGYQRIGGNLIFQWGTVGPAASGTVTLPLAYANSSSFKVFVQGDAVAGTFNSSVNRTSASQFSYILNASAVAHWFAIGYI